jgi:biopolymer transport protein ExbD
MINVVFLLLVFFLMTATIRPPEPFAVSPPEAALGAEAERRGALYLAADGRLAGRGARGEAAIAAAAGAGGPVPLVADRGVPARVLARTLRRLSEAGVPRVELVMEAAR